MTIAKKQTTIAENEPYVYLSGRNDEYDAFWDAYQMNGIRSSYQYAFYHYGWDDKTFHPKYDIVPNGGYTTNSLFAHSRFTVLPVVVDLTKSTTELSSIFSGCTVLKTIRKIIFSESNTFYNPFNGCTALENITVGGTIGQNGLSFQWSPNLTHDSLMSIINALADKSGDTSGTAWKLTIGAENCDKLSAEDFYIAWEKGWEIE